MEPWPQDADLVECVVDGIPIDLHNASDLSRIDWSAGEQELTVEVAYDPARYGAVEVPDARPRRVVLTFEGVRGLVMSQVEDFDPQSARDVHEWSWRPAGERGEVTWTLGELELQLEAAAVRFTADPPIVDYPARAGQADAETPDG